MSAYLPTRNADGYPIDAPTFVDSGGYDGCFSGFRMEIEAGAQTIYDYKLLTNIKIQGGWRMLVSASGTAVVPNTDYMELSVVDKDDKLGMFSTYGLTVGVDVLELFKYVRKHYTSSEELGKRYQYEFPSAKFLLADLYLRAVYNSNGDDDLVLLGDYKWYEG